jgi:hypothetical protein
VTQWAKKRNI